LFPGMIWCPRTFLPTPNLFAITYPHVSPIRSGLALASLLLHSLAHPYHKVKGGISLPPLTNPLGHSHDHSFTRTLAIPSQEVVNVVPCRLLASINMYSTPFSSFRAALRSASTGTTMVVPVPF